MSEGLESSHEGEAATAAAAGDEDESVDGMGEVAMMMRMEMMVRTLVDSSPAPRPSLHVTFAGGVLAVDCRHYYLQFIILTYHFTIYTP